MFQLFIQQHFIAQWITSNCVSDTQASGNRTWLELKYIETALHILPSAASWIYLDQKRFARKFAKEGVKYLEVRINYFLSNGFSKVWLFVEGPYSRD